MQIFRTILTVAICLHTLDVCADTNLRIQARLRADQILERNNDTYRRIYRLCKSNMDLSLFQYTSSGARQIWSFSNTETLLSPLLDFDLQQYSFYLALNDCKYTQFQKNIFVAQLITQDLIGKVLGVGSIYVGIRFATHAPKIYPSTTLTATMASPAAFYLFKYLYPEEIPSSKNARENVERQIDDTLDLDEREEKREKLRKTVIQLLQKDLEIIDAEIQKATSPQSRSDLEEQYQDVTNKLDLLLTKR